MREQAFPSEEPLAGSYDRITESAAENLGELRQRLRDFDREAQVFVREHPIASVALAAVAGFVLGRIAARYL